MKLVIAAGGTAGHVNPALSTARALTDADLVFIGRPRSFEQELVHRAGFAFRELDVRGLDRRKLLAAPGTALRAARAVIAAGHVLDAVRPDAVLGMGGYVSLPVSVAARRRRVPAVIHEQNIVLGLANRISKRWAAAVAVSWAETMADAGPRAVLTGNPVAPALARFDRAGLRRKALEELGLAAGRKTILVFGGSQGAARLSSIGVGLPALLGGRDDVQVLHITGARAPAAGVAPSGGVPYREVRFIDRMELAYAAADVAIVRGGATTVAELCVTGVPAVIVPYPHHRDRQQERHAAVLEAGGAAVTVPDPAATPQRIATIVTEWLDRSDELARRAGAARRLARPEAAAALAEVVTGVARSRARAGAA